MAFACSVIQTEEDLPVCAMASDAVVAFESKSPELDDLTEGYALTRGLARPGDHRPSSHGDYLWGAETKFEEHYRTATVWQVEHTS